jgi:hypothetical protein
MTEKSKTSFSRSRRRLLIGAGAGAVACAGAAGVVWSSSERNRARWIEQVIRSNLPGITIDEASLARFVQETLTSPSMQSTRRRLGIAADAQVPWLTRRIHRVEQGVEITERQVLTNFLIGSNFFRVSEPERETIVYYGGIPACSNPFVRYT